MALPVLTSLRGRLSPNITKGGGSYDGSYEVTTDVNDRLILNTAGKLLSDDIIIYPPAYAEVSNPGGGITVTIGSDLI